MLGVVPRAGCLVVVSFLHRIVRLSLGIHVTYRSLSFRWVLVSGVAPQQPHYRREVRNEEDVGARGGNTSGPRERAAGDEPPAVRKKLVRTQNGRWTDIRHTDTQAGNKRSRR